MRNCSLRFCVSAVCLLLSFLNAGKAQLLGKSATLHRWKRQSCGSDGFHCKSGTCIKSTLMCDGAVNCDDGSDETKEACLNTVVPVLASFLEPPLTSYIDSCPPFAFQCNYGGCVNADFKCDGKKDCADGSDEAGCPGSTAIAGGTTCGPNTLQCRSGQCIEETRKCDGKKDCNDGTDETREQCGFISCPDFAFQCVYGACIDGNARCNGVVECADGSDENSQVCGRPSQPINPPVRPPPPTSAPAPPSPGCILPQYPEYGTYGIGGCAPPNCPPPGTDVGNIALLNFSCNAGYSLSGSTIMFCQNGKWQYQQPTCTSVSCDPLVSVSREIQCIFNQKKVPCNQRMSVGTVADVQCKPYYNQAAELNIFQMVCQFSGRWSRELSSCIPECGTRNAEGELFISNGIKTKLGQFPWHIGIYSFSNDSLQQICGGSLISSRTVISAAHCFYDEKNDKQFDKNGYRIGVGKYYRDWNTRNKYFQEGQIEDIVLPDRYKGITFRYESDIAIIKLKVEIEINVAVRPICIDRDLRYENIQLSNGQLGAVSGWGVNEDNGPSSELMAAYLPYIDFRQCYDKVPSTFQTFLTTDKFCAGHQNGTSVCPGDSGGGLMFEDSQTKKWYLQGIVSVGVPPKGANKCYTMQYSAFTKVSRYYNFIDENMIR